MQSLTASPIAFQFFWVIIEGEECSPFLVDCRIGFLRRLW